MTSTVELDAMTPAAQPTRDRWGRPLLVPPDGGKRRPYTRVTTIAKTLADTSALTGWERRMVALGLLARPDLLAAVAAADPADRDTLNKITEQAKEAAAASAAANLGTALHRLVERVARQELAVDAVPEPWRADVHAVFTALDQAGLAVVESELFVVHDQLEAAGTCDFVLADRTGRTLIGDLKTGSTTAYGAGEWAVQLALYASASAVYDPTSDQRRPMPAVDQTVAVIVHAPAGTGAATVHQLDIAAGTEALDHAMWVRGWRRRKDILTPWQEPDRQVEGLVHRMRQLTPQAVASLRQQWPEGVPTLKQGGHTPAELGAIAAALDRVETNHQQPFNDLPVPPQPRPTTPAPPIEPADDEGGPLDPAAVDAIRLRWQQLDPDSRQTVDTITRQAAADGQPVSLAMRPTVRRGHIAQALIILAPYGPDVITAALHGQPAGRLTTSQAAQLHQTAREFDGGTLTLTYEGNSGHPTLAASTNGKASGTHDQ